MQHRMRRASAFFFFCRSPDCIICVFVCSFDSCRWESAFASRFLAIAHFFSPCYITFFPCIRGVKGDNMNCLAVLSVFFFSPFLLARFNVGSVSIDSPFFFLGISTTFFQLEFSVLFPQPFFKASIMTKTTGWFLFFFSVLKLILRKERRK